MAFASPKYLNLPFEPLKLLIMMKMVTIHFSLWTFVVDSEGNGNIKKQETAFKNISVSFTFHSGGITTVFDGIGGIKEYRWQINPTDYNY